VHKVFLVLKELVLKVQQVCKERLAYRVFQVRKVQPVRKALQAHKAQPDQLDRKAQPDHKELPEPVWSSLATCPQSEAHHKPH
jgi:hypothetical protein